MSEQNWLLFMIGTPTHLYFVPKGVVCVIVAMALWTTTRLIGLGLVWIARRKR